MKENNTLKDLLLRSAYAIVRSLATILLKQGVGYSLFSEVARAAYIDAAGEFVIEGRKLSDSRISVITGLSRKEVARLKGRAVPDLSDTDNRHNRAVRVVTAWNREKKYLNSRGDPRVLPESGATPSLHDLVTEYGGGVPTRAVIDELSRVGAIAPSKGGRWRLENSAYVPSASDKAVVKILGTDVPFLIQTIHHNREASVENKWFQRKVMYEDVPDQVVEKFRRYATKESFTLLKKLDRWLSGEIKKGTDKQRMDGKGSQVGVSAFYFEKCNEEGSIDE